MSTRLSYNHQLVIYYEDRQYRLTGDGMIHPMSVIDPLQCWLIQAFVQQLEKKSGEFEYFKKLGHGG